jgi:hypothetical protein
VAEHRLGPEFTNRPGHLAARGAIVRQLAVDASEEPHLTGRPAAQPLRGGPLLALTATGEFLDVGIHVPGALRAVGADQVVHDAPVRRPLREQPAAAELHVVRVGADGERRRRRRQIAGEPLAQA